MKPFSKLGRVLKAKNKVIELPYISDDVSVQVTLLF